MIYARFNGVDYKLEERPVLTFSASETTFSEIVVDFTGKTASDLPIKYQEIQVVDTSTDPDTVLYYGYCSQPSLPAFNNTQERVLLTIELMSPQTYLCKRTIDLLVEGETINDALGLILAPLTSHDGFTIQHNDAPIDKILSEFYSHRTIESVLTSLGARYGFIWYVDELKRIYIKDLENIISSPPIYSITEASMPLVESVQPHFNVSDYANRLNFINVNLITTENVMTDGMGLVDGESYKFIHPISIARSVAHRFGPGTWVLLKIQTSGGTYNITSTYAGRLITLNSAIGYSGEDDDNASKKILLERDSNNSSVITGFKWSGTTETAVDIVSTVALKPTTMTYIDPVEITGNAGKLNTSGIVERDVDANWKYYTFDELTDYAKTLFRQNNKQADIVTIKFSGEALQTYKDLLMPTNKIYVNLPNQFIDPSDYIITDMEYVIQNEIATLVVSAKRANLSENYVDIFRKTDEPIDENQARYITYYNQDEQTVLAHKIIVDGEEVDV